MLDPRDVRPGNWVLKHTGKDAAMRSFFEYKAVAIDEYYFTFAKFCFPILISPVILAKCGFIHESGDWYLNITADGASEESTFLRLKQADKSWYLKDIRLWSQPLYLHQLQNLVYSLSGKELKINLGFFENITMVGPIDFFVKPMNIALPKKATDQAHQPAII